jgi:uncharacterized protein YheU (UPF0270 family)
MVDEPAAPVEVDPQALAPETLRALVEEFVTRDGTDYGASEASLERKVEDVLRQLARGDLRIVFDPESSSANIIAAGESSRR